MEAQTLDYDDSEVSFEYTSEVSINQMAACAAGCLSIFLEKQLDVNELPDTVLLMQLCDGFAALARSGEPEGAAYAVVFFRCGMSIFP
jgi:hypothetical protein